VPAPARDMSKVREALAAILSRIFTKNPPQPVQNRRARVQAQRQQRPHIAQQYTSHHRQKRPFPTYRRRLTRPSRAHRRRRSTMKSSRPITTRRRTTTTITTRTTTTRQSRSQRRSLRHSHRSTDSHQTESTIIAIPRASTGTRRECHQRALRDPAITAESTRKQRRGRR
jgi:hypothetical protein